MCKCVETTNKLLAEHNTVIDTREAINMKTGKCRPVLLVPTVKIDTKKRAPAINLFAKFCPLCGVSLAP